MHSLTPKENRRTFLGILNAAIVGTSAIFLAYNAWTSYDNALAFYVNLSLFSLGLAALLLLRYRPESHIPSLLVLLVLLIFGSTIMYTAHEDPSRLYWLWPIILVLVYTHKLRISLFVNALLLFFVFVFLTDPFGLGTGIGNTKDRLRLIGALGIFWIAVYTIHYFHFRLEDSLSALAYRDLETGLANRNGLFREIERWCASGKNGFSLLLFDLDKYQQVSSSLGTRGSAKLIESISKFLEENFDKCFVARLSIDVFALLSTETHKAKIEEQAKKIIDKLFHLSESSSYLIYLSAGFGVTLVPQDSGNAEETIHLAELALAEAKKQQASNALIFYHPDINKKFKKRETIKRLIHRGLKANEFSLVYQPQFRARDMKPVSIEALVRWKQEELGYISPSEFIPIAEESNLIFALGDYVRDQAFQDLRKLHDAGHSHIHLSINLSPRELLNQELSLRIIEKLHQYELKASDLVLEITEGVLLEHGLRSMRALRKLREAGLAIALDDYGTGYAGVQYLLRFQIQTLKLDRSLILNFDRHKHKKALLRGILTTTQELGIESVSEGVETKEQIAWLKDAGCDTLQGYLPAKPLRLESLIEFLNTDLSV